MKKARITKDEQERKTTRDLVAVEGVPSTQQRAKSRRSSSSGVVHTISTSVAEGGDVQPTTLPEEDNPIVTDMTYKHLNTARLRRKSSRAGNLSSSSSMAVFDETSLTPEATAATSTTAMNQQPSVALTDTTHCSPTVDAGPEEDETAHIRDKVVTLAAREMDEHEGLDEASLREHEEVTKVKNVAQVQIGPFLMDTWYFSPLPKELFKESTAIVTPHSSIQTSNAPSDNPNSSSASSLPTTTAPTTTPSSGATSNILQTLYVCEFTLQFFARKEELLRYQARGTFMKYGRHPPGNEIYRSHTQQGHLLSMFEVDGLEAKTYCQNLCYIGTYHTSIWCLERMVSIIRVIFK